MRASLLVLLGLEMAAACGRNTRAPAPAGPSAAKAATASEPESAAIDAASRMGQRLFAQDQISAAATDLVQPGGLPATVEGWITRQTSDGWRVDFFSSVAGRAVALATVRFGPKGAASPPVRHAVPEALDEEGQAMASARAAAIAAFRPICGGPHNVDVVPASVIGKPGWYVYFSPGTTKPDEVVLAGHVRIAVAVGPAGSEVTEVMPLARSCGIGAPPGSSDDHRVAISITHMVTPTPTEAHVFASLLSDVPLVVVTPAGMWIVDGSAIARARREPLE